MLRHRQEIRQQLDRDNTKLIIVCGLPGSGKTTHAKLLEQKLKAIRFCPDEWFEALSLDLYDEGQRARIEALQWQLAQELLKHDVSVVIEWGTWGKAERDALRLRARDIGVAVELHYLAAPVDILFDRIQRRGMESPPIMREQLAHWAKMFQEPTLEETALFDGYLLLSPSGS
jgi:predicted kinase